MKRWQRVLMMVAAGFAALVMMAPDADARRLGGGRSFGKQSNIIQKRNAPAQPPAGQGARQQQGAGGAAAAAGGKRWLGPLGGLAAGLGLAWLASSLGLSEEFGTIIMIALLAGLGLMLFRRLMAGQRRTALQGAGGPMLREALREPAAAPGGGQAAGSDVGAGQPIGVPAGFDVDAFLHQARVQFVRLQAVFDAGDLKDLREFTSPEVFAELKLQIDEARGVAQRTDVVELEAELLGIETTRSEYLAAVRYTGMVREQADLPAEPFAEIWTLSKPVDGPGGWVLSGIQQEG